MEDTLRDKIRAYLNGQLPEQERDAFQAEIQKNDYLAAEVDLMRLEITMLDVVHEDWIRGKMKEWEEVVPAETAPETTARRIIWKDFLWKYRVGLILALLCLLIALFRRPPNESHNEIPVALSFDDSFWSSYGFGNDKQYPISPLGKGPYTPNSPVASAETEMQTPYKRHESPEIVEINPVRQTLPRPTSPLDKQNPVQSFNRDSACIALLEKSISDQKETLSSLSGDDGNWSKDLLDTNYSNACLKLQNITATKENLIDYPDAFYYAALLKMYNHNCAININPAKTLSSLSYEQLAPSLPDLDETEFIKHKTIAQALETNASRADSLIFIALYPTAFINKLAKEPPPTL